MIDKIIKFCDNLITTMNDVLCLVTVSKKAKKTTQEGALMA